MAAPNIETIVSLSKRRGFVYPASEVYGGLGSSWDYGPLGVELANNIKKSWWNWVVYERDDVEGVDSSIILNRLVWKYSGHETTFSDPLVDCRSCKTRLREDKLDRGADGKLVCSNCGSTDLTESRQFNLMFRTTLGAASAEEDESALAYLRPETAQGIFINFKNVLDTSRRKLPFGIAQVGKAFRNEVTPGNFIFRTREFEQMEIEYFCRPEDAPRIHQEWIDAYDAWLGAIGISSVNIKHYEQSKEELAHYSDRTVDFLYRFFPEREEEDKQFDELLGIANRTDYDLRVHSKKPEDADGKRINPDSTDDLSYFDPQTNERFYPYCIEPSIGVNRTMLAILMDAYTEKTTEKGEKRVILKLTSDMAPIKAAVLPLAKNNEGIVAMAKRLKQTLQPHMRTVYDDTGGIGKLYARQDEIGTPFCVTVDHESLEDNAVTVRHRDTWEQERVSTERLDAYLKEHLSYQSGVSGAV